MCFGLLASESQPMVFKKILSLLKHHYHLIDNICKLGPICRMHKLSRFSFSHFLVNLLPDETCHKAVIEFTLLSKFISKNQHLYTGAKANEGFNKVVGDRSIKL